MPRSDCWDARRAHFFQLLLGMTRTCAHATYHSLHSPSIFSLAKEGEEEEALPLHPSIHIHIHYSCSHVTQILNDILEKGVDDAMTANGGEWH